jgi:formylglycine-generating enzyme required for sulfatase activity
MRKVGDIIFVPIPGGEFTMGCDAGSSNERPAHRVRVEPFLMAQTEVTVAQFATFVRATGYVTDAERLGSQRGWDGTDWVDVKGASWRTPPPPHDDLPVSGISWNDALAYCAWAGVRLPTEVEWEYAAAGGRANQVWAGTDRDDALREYAWFRGSSAWALHPVGQKRPNRFGLFDMSGNVAEWCEDWYQFDRYDAAAGLAACGPPAKKARVLRGGTAFQDAARVRVANRAGHAPELRHSAVGFRPVLDLPPVEREN